MTPSYSTTALTSASPNNTIRVLKCGSGSPANQAAVIAGNIVGLQVISFDYAANAESSPLNIGTTTGAGIACPTS